ncbi:hypothetical protein BTN49_0170 [Candidatus Enterovibrio escicola]|uniref:Uncharacterized protein n=1 Tax=Candidatus Enterovibrio escicola TaxID=1927127 RepID=A0A2A5T7S3_9GAMM|nr:hypothetical protein BTN49_0170 [Candidatus Enterovibrio escacola]
MTNIWLGIVLTLGSFIAWDFICTTIARLGIETIRIISP